MPAEHSPEAQNSAGSHTAHDALRTRAMLNWLGMPWLRQAWHALSGYYTLDIDTLIPGGDLRPTEEPTTWEACGPDPHFLIPVATNRHYLRLEFEAQLLGDALPEQGQVELYYDLGKGFDDTARFSTLFNEDVIVVDAVIAMGAEALALRLDPVDSPCRFKIRKLRLRACNSLAATLLRARASLTLLAKRNQLARQGLHALAAFSRGKFKHGLELLFDSVGTADTRYIKFMEARAVDRNARQALAAAAERFAIKPVFSIVVPTYNSPAPFLERALRSVLDQTYPHWELCIADDGSPNRDDIRRVLDPLAAGDSRIKIDYLARNCGISQASNAALAKARGDFIVLLDHDDELRPHALHAFAQAINRAPDVDFLYSDEDKIDLDGNRFGPFFKPDWSPAYMLGCMYTCHLGAYRRTLVEEVGGFRSAFDFAQDYDLALRVVTETDRIHHIPDILYSWRTLPGSTAGGNEAKPAAELKARAAVQAFLDRGRYKGLALPGPHPGTHRVKFELIGNPLISIVMAFPAWPSGNSGGHSILDLAKQIRENSTYRPIEILCPMQDNISPELIHALTEVGVTLVACREAQSPFAVRVNAVAAAAEGEYLVILNEAVRVKSAEWLEEMLMWAQQDAICAAGAKVFCPDGRISHAGVLLLERGPVLAHHNAKSNERGLAGIAVLPHEVSGLTGCIMVRRQDYLAHGGFDSGFNANLGMIDFCLRLRSGTGKRIVFTPYASLQLLQTRDPDAPDDLGVFMARWRDTMGHDRYYNANLSQSPPGYHVRAEFRSLAEEYEISRDG